MSDTIRCRFMNKSCVFVLLVGILCFMTTACTPAGKNDGAMQNVESDKVVNIIGKEKQEILKTFETLINDTDLTADEIELNQPMKYESTDVKIKLMFENDVLFRVQYNFGEKNELAFDYKEELYSYLKETYGDPDTYPTMPDRIEELTFEKYMDGEQFRHQEYWIDVHEALMNSVPEEYKSEKRLDLGIGIDKISTDPTRTAIFVGGIVNNVDTHKLD